MGLWGTGVVLVVGLGRALSPRYLLPVPVTGGPLLQVGALLQVSTFPQAKKTCKTPIRTPNFVKDAPHDDALMMAPS